MMRKVQMITGDKKYDDVLPLIFRYAGKHMVDNNDDGFFIITGRTGAGKSKLSMHIFDLIAPDVGIEQYALTIKDFARAQKQAVNNKSQGKTGIYVYDEADLNKRGAMSVFNRDVIKLMFTNRVFGIWQFWCWVSVDMLDKPFIQERLSGLFYCHSKERHVPRRYFYFAKDQLLRMIEEGIPLTHAELYRNRKKYASYMGWFRDYDGRLSEMYRQLKLIGAQSHTDDFYTKYAEGGLLTGDTPKEGTPSPAAPVKVYDATAAAMALGVNTSLFKKLASKARIENAQINSKYKRNYGWTLNDVDLDILRSYIPKNGES